MSADELLAELNECFQRAPYPGDLNIVTNNAPDYDLESLQIRETFKAHTWQTLPDELMLYEQGGCAFLSKAGFKYYLPAYLSFAVRDYSGADSIPDNLIFSLTSPVEVDVIISAVAIMRDRTDERVPKVDWTAIHQRELREINQRIHRFIDRHSQFSPAQSRAIYHFLVYMRDEHGPDYWSKEPDIAIERYWFQFA